MGTGHNGQNGQLAINHVILECIEDGGFVQIRLRYMVVAIVLESQKTTKLAMSTNAQVRFFYIHMKNYNTCYIYVLLYFLITLQQYNTTGTRPQGARDNDYPVAINIKTCFKNSW